VKRIEVEPPTSEARRDRVERRVFDQLAAVRMIDRTDAVLPEIPRARPRWVVPAFGLLAAAAAVVLLATRGGGDAPSTQATAPSRVVTGSSSSQFMVGEDVIDAGSDTSVEVQQDASGITLVLGRGSVECDVVPRAGRPPFHVVAGDMTVEVVGTHFTVTRTPIQRVDVARGKVKVTAPGGTWLVSAGESWPLQTASAAPVPSPSPISESSTSTSTTEEPAVAPKHKPVKVEDPGVLYDRIETHAESEPVIAVREADEFLRRYPQDIKVEFVTYLRIEALVKAKRVTEARRAANDYLKQFPRGTYRDRVSDIAAQK
jgi:hypothetical protein